HATPGHVERSPRAAAPEHMTPPAHTERNVAPKHEPAGSAYRPNEGRHIPERSDVARAQGNLHAARQRTEASHQPNNIKREEGRPR
ncbi:MAG TPA: hypothetical protein VLD55_11150, partial [Candidatus Sulfobium mesophilum]|nr:hypothetical protein [Candidatus Sulfobium mesophilum]